ncbi:MAG: hypothetical protein JSS58_09700, partial [Proteobacteria bacterium]|nr:hypothetical protein [Pseudomonadota bacterium]
MRAPTSLLWATLCLFLLAACSPTFDWREVRGAAPAPYTALLPAKPASLTRPIRLSAVTVDMRMQAVETDGHTFAIGSAELPAGVSASAALTEMKSAMVANIHGSVRKEEATAGGIAVEAAGKSSNGRPLYMQARFI